MTTIQRTTIYSFSNDVLWTIFDINADMTQPSEPDRYGTTTRDDLCLTEANPEKIFTFRDRHSALTTTLRTSQVCYHWRNLLIKSSRVWGRLLDFDVLRRAKVQLRDEICRRAGCQSLLSVKGFQIPFPSPHCDFIFELIAKQWVRLRWVDIYIQTNRVTISIQQSQFWNAITTPAPNLRRFSFVFSRPMENQLVLTHAAPSLRELCTTPSSPLHLDSPWLRQLTFLSIDGVGLIGQPIVPNTFPAFLDALSGLSNLATLRLIYTSIAESDYNTYENVQLPNLRELIFEEYFATCFAVLQHITPTQLCTIKIQTASPHQIPDAQCRKLMKSFKIYLKSRTYNDRVLIDLQPDYFSFVDADPDCYPLPTTSIEITNLSQSVGPISFFDVLPLSNFTHVKSLWFRLDLIGINTAFYNSFLSLEVIKTTRLGFDYLAMATRASSKATLPIPLPCVQRISIIKNVEDAEREVFSRGLNQSFVEEFIELFKMRREKRNPIKHLDIRGRSKGDLRGLDICTGLKVTWASAQFRDGDEPGEYICGSGNQRILKL
ncbi:hypothetical protein GALMADRAFT_159028 [Galerina marginata CBS 339.88]|uniref:F-box domain-containing protein n=1 Tax=Galerina marginata (strain CBS 339.88) TaxID=685588 RepID=A0A067SXB5_GALM3|nr:hypothetical protein GALMADRAFT_159028 [Galerina marginata CBS 339.88]